MKASNKYALANSPLDSRTAYGNSCASIATGGARPPEASGSLSSVASRLSLMVFRKQLLNHGLPGFSGCFYG
jgi:hypothetical protein